MTADNVTQVKSLLHAKPLVKRLACSKNVVGLVQGLTSVLQCGGPYIEIVFTKSESVTLITKYSRFKIQTALANGIQSADRTEDGCSTVAQPNETKKQENGEAPHTSLICHHSFTNLLAAIKYQEVHAETRNCYCSVCEISFASERGHQQHIRRKNASGLHIPDRTSGKRESGNPCALQLGRICSSIGDRFTERKRVKSARSVEHCSAESGILIGTWEPCTESNSITFARNVGNGAAGGMFLGDMLKAERSCVIRIEQSADHLRTCVAISALTLEAVCFATSSAFTGMENK
ncbi:hypothetical protein T265_11197 [Opisthorchis viverrini]|uniref:C2H2-type domain-containing protein n=1 Tax=Opisthorchis viverrini TaxID=6198 RepID=A0A074ZAG3_OPIVI|nr:hypothetical protein T265_11197 [Opisthorchis viverrini]KER20200.1 hypothetical protein T265_11197 [Opisthorchis viverrini]